MFPEMSEMPQSAPPANLQSRAQQLGPQMGFSARTPEIACKMCVSAQAPFLGDHSQPSSQTGRKGLWTLRPKAPKPATGQGGRPHQLSDPINTPVQCVGVGHRFAIGKMIKTDHIQFGEARVCTRVCPAARERALSHTAAVWRGADS